jgi:hypothetical protein
VLQRAVPGVVAVRRDDPDGGVLPDLEVSVPLVLAVDGDGALVSTTGSSRAERRGRAGAPARRPSRA